MRRVIGGTLRPSEEPDKDKLKAILDKVRLEEFEKEELLNSFREVLKAYRSHFGEDAEIRYHIRKKLVRLELVLSVKGEKWNVVSSMHKSITGIFLMVDRLSKHRTSRSCLKK